jgi:S-methylmethionine-dependent homocysteine/selenocysteine methylase
MYEHIARKLATGEVIIIDGGTGTDIQRRGAAMSGDTWCADANLTHPAIVREVHADYIRAGAEIITANTFATSALLFNALGRDRELIEIDRAAVALATEAAADRPVAIAGSVSTMRPVFAGSDRTSKQREWPEKDARALFRRKVDTLVHCGVDLLMMEMMRDTDYSVWATEAAIATGVPVWVGISVEKNKDGVLAGFGREDMPLDDVARALAAVRPAVVSIMHTSPSDTDEAIAVVRKYWKGPLGAYPESGYFRMPEWTFVDIIPPKELVEKARVWRARGVSIFGGCCGLGPEHIEALHQEFTP